MPYGGGNWLLENKPLPGVYVNFVSVRQVSPALTERGIAAIPMPLDWGQEGIITMDAVDFNNKAKEVFGYPFDAAELKPVRELFKRARQVHFGRVNTEGGVKASNSLAEATCVGTRGNKLSVVISSDPAATEELPLFVVRTTLDAIVVDEQAGISEDAANLKPNAWLVWKDGITLDITAGTPLADGADGVTTADDYQKFLNQLDKKFFHTLGLPSTDPTLKLLFIQYTKRMRDEVGKKFQTVIYKQTGDHEGVINLHSGLADPYTGAEIDDPAMVYWVTGARAGCAVNKTLANGIYDGEYLPYDGFTQIQLEQALKAGQFVFHEVDGQARVLDDINSFTSFSNEKNIDFQSNQTIAVLDQIAIDTAIIFQDKYLGKVQNNKAGREALWSDLVAHRKQLERIEATENFDPDELTVDPSTELKKAVIIRERTYPVNAMQQIYSTVYVA